MMLDALMILSPALVMTALMVVTHAYFGLHILARGIIFADLALAQMAALGASVAFLAGAEAHDSQTQFYTFAATILAAIAFSQLRRIKDATTREVTIGVVYVVSTALSVVILSQSAQGMEELKAIFNGNILWVSWQEIGIVALAYAVIFSFHYVFREKFVSLSFSDSQQRPDFRWEMIFFVSFAIVITMAVNVAGVLLVFAFLIIPAFSATLISLKFTSRLLISWMLGMLGSLAGLLVAFLFDLPVGATVVAVVGMLPLLSLLVRLLKS